MPSTTPMPTGEITVLFTDIEDSTRRWQQRPGEMAESLQRHDAILRGEADRHGGIVFDHMGDGIAIAFQEAADAIEASIAMQAQLQNLPWSGEDRLRVRMALHTGESLVVAGEYRGPTIITVARITDLANGDQIALSQPHGPPGRQLHASRRRAPHAQGDRKRDDSSGRRPEDRC